MTRVTHTIGRWDYHPAIHGEEGISFVIYPAGTSEPLAHVLARDEDEHIAALMAAAPALLDELQRAHRIIRNALNVMTGEQKGQWGAANCREFPDSGGVTRFWERKAIIEKAWGKA